MLNYIMSIIITIIVIGLICLYIMKMIELDAKATNKANPWKNDPFDEHLHPMDAERAKFIMNNPDPIIYGIEHQNHVARKMNQKSIKDIDFEELQYNSANGVKYISNSKDVYNGSSK